MTKKIRQSKGRNYRQFEITEDALLVERKKIGQFDRYQLSWEEIDFDAVVQGRAFDTRRLILTVSILLNVVFLFVMAYLKWPAIWGRWWFYLLLVLTTLAFIPAIISLFKAERNMILYGESNVVFYYRPEDQAAVDAFVDDMKVARQNYLRHRFLQIDELLPLEDQLSVIQSLYLKKMISRADLQHVMEEVKVRRLFDQ